MLLRRRLTPLGQAAIGAAHAVGADASMLYVFASRHGEFQRSLRLMVALARGEGLSPADFSLSVHNALAGLLSIAEGAHAGHTAIAAGPDSFAAGLLEAVALLAAQPTARVLLVYYDDDLPAPFASLQNEAPVGALALAVLLVSPLANPDDQAGGETLAFSAIAQPAGPSRPTISQAEDFLRFLAGTEAQGTAAGGRMALEWRRAS